MRSNQYNRPYTRYANKDNWMNALDSQNPGEALIYFFKKYHDGPHELSMAIDNVRIQYFNELLRCCLESLNMLCKCQHQQNYYFINQILASDQFFRLFVNELQIMQNKYQTQNFDNRQIENDKQFLNYFLNFTQQYLRQQPINYIKCFLQKIEQTLYILNSTVKAFNNELNFLNSLIYPNQVPKQQNQPQFSPHNFRNNDSFMTDSDFEEIPTKPKSSQEINQEISSQIFSVPIINRNPPNNQIPFQSPNQIPAQNVNQILRQNINQIPVSNINHPKQNIIQFPSQSNNQIPVQSQIPVSNLNQIPKQNMNQFPQQNNNQIPASNINQVSQNINQVSQTNSQRSLPRVSEKQQEFFNPVAVVQQNQSLSFSNIPKFEEQVNQKQGVVQYQYSYLPNNNQQNHKEQPKQQVQQNQIIQQDDQKSSNSSVCSKQFIDDNYQHLIIEQRQKHQQQLVQQLEMDDIEISYKICPIEPSQAEFQKNIDCNKVFGGKIVPIPIQKPYKSTEIFVNNNYFILREDYIKNFRQAVSILKAQGFQDISKKVVENVFLYSNALVENILVTNKGLQFVITMNVFDIRKRKINWRQTKRLMPGSLLLLSSLNLQFMLFGTVVEKPMNDVNGRVSVVLQITELTTAQQLEYINILLSVENQLVVIENQVYYETYTHFLKCLKNADTNNIPFSDQIVYAKNDMPLPGYLDTPQIKREGIEYEIDLKFDLHQQKQIGKISKINILREWPELNSESLDKSQLKAIQIMLRNGITLIQGPPGTGKTFCGALGVRILLQNQFKWNKDYQQINKPILIVCQTNHALDQFLQHILTFCDKKDVVRIGGRCKVAEFQEILLSNNQQDRKIQFRWKEFLELRDDLDYKLRNLLNLIDNVNYQDVETIEPNLANKIIEQYLKTEDLQFAHPLLEESRKLIIHMWIDTYKPKQEDAEKIIQNELNQGNKLKNNQINRGDYKGIIVYKIDDLQNVFSLSQEAQQQIQQDQLDDIDDNDNVDSDEEANRVQNNNPGEEKNNLVSKLIDDQRSLKRLLNRLGSQNEISFKKIMEELSQNPNYKIWEMPQSKRNIITRQIFAQKFRDRFKKLQISVQRYDQFIEGLKWAYIERDLQFIQTKKIVGVTLTGCAKYADKLQNLNFNILVVEEAAEVLESNLVSVLSQNINHLILIGDHQQLKPHLYCYDLEVKYRANISLFERLIKNGLEYVTLNEQRRMKTIFADFIRLIYKGKYFDHVSINELNKVKIQGLKHDLLFFNHHKLEAIEQFSSSKSNDFEVQMIKHFSDYLIMNGIKPQQITILSTYGKQALKIKSVVQRNIKIQTVDNYQGEENDIVILSLVRSNNNGSLGFVGIDNRVCVAFSRARIGFYIFGNFEFIEDCIYYQLRFQKNPDISDIWLQIIQLAKQKQVMLDHIPLECPSHKEIFQIREIDDWEEYHFEGCTKVCGQQFPCGHICQEKCHNSDHKQEDCKDRCTKKLQCGHQCPGGCGRQCQPCKVKIEKVLPQCGHQAFVFCSDLNLNNFRCYSLCQKKLECGHQCRLKCFEDCKNQQCQEIIDIKLDRCEHKIKIYCYKLKNKDQFFCQENCQEILFCGHNCQGSCGKCFNKFHFPCQQKCDKILNCDHKCQLLCQLDCYECKQKCQIECYCGDKCLYRCDDQCRQCLNPCKLSCQHSKCNKKCFELCDRNPCNQRCQNILQCGCQCMGFCGEKCPNICLDKFHNTKLADEDTIYYQLECQCNIIMKAQEMDDYFGSIQPKQFIRCPNCGLKLWKSSRYQEIIKKFINFYQEQKKIKSQKYQITYDMIYKLRDQVLIKLNFIRDKNIKDKSSFLNNILIETNKYIKNFNNQKGMQISYQHYICIKKQVDLFDQSLQLQQSNNNNKLFNIHKICLLENYLLNEDFRDFYSDAYSWKLEQKIDSLLLFQKSIQMFSETQNLKYQNISFEIEDSHFFLDENNKKKIIQQLQNN